LSAASAGKLRIAPIASVTRLKAQENFPKCGARSERARRVMSGTLRSEPPPFGAGVGTVCSTESKECLNQNNRQIGKLS